MIEREIANQILLLDDEKLLNLKEVFEEFITIRDENSKILTRGKMFEHIIRAAFYRGDIFGGQKIYGDATKLELVIFKKKYLRLLKFFNIEKNALIFYELDYRDLMKYLIEPLYSEHFLPFVDFVIEHKDQRELIKRTIRLNADYSKTDELSLEIIPGIIDNLNELLDNLENIKTKNK